MKYLILIAAVILFWVIGLMLLVSSNPKAYDCSLAEISPDYPVRVKEACREIRRKK